MAMRPSTTALLGGFLLAAVLTPSLTAYAATVDVTDATSDVWENFTNDGEYVPTELTDNLDVTSLEVRHLAKRIVVTAGYAELKKAGVPLVLSSRLRFDDGPAVTIMVDANPRWSGDGVLFGRRGPLDCGGFDHAIDYAANTVELSVPRKCVGGPTWVETNYVGLGYVEDSDAESGYRNYRDNALSDGSSQGGWTDKVRRGATVS